MVATPNTIACERFLELLTARKPQLYFQHVADLDQLRQLWQIDQAAYLDCSLSFERFQEWWERYEFGSRVLLDGDQILASIGIYPLYDEQAAAFSAGTIPESDLKPVLCDECEAEPRHNWYASGIVVAESLRGSSNSPLKTLLQLGLNNWLRSGHVAYPLHLWSIAEYEVGARLLDFFGFVKVRDGSSLPDSCDLYHRVFETRDQAHDFLKRKGLR